MKSRFYLIFLAFFLIFSQNIAVKSENFNQNPEAVSMKCLDGGIMFVGKWSNIPPELGEPSAFEGYIELEQFGETAIRQSTIPLYFAHVFDNDGGLETYYWYSYFELSKGRYDLKSNGSIQGREFSNSVNLQCNFVLFPITINNN